MYFSAVALSSAIRGLFHSSSSLIVAYLTEIEWQRERRPPFSQEMLLRCAERRVPTAISIDRRNTLCKPFGRCFEPSDPIRGAIVSFGWPLAHSDRIGDLPMCAASLPAIPNPRFLLVRVKRTRTVLLQQHSPLFTQRPGVVLII